MADIVTAYDAYESANNVGANGSRTPRSPSSGKQIVTVDVFAADEQSDHPVDTLRWVRLAEAVLGEEGLTGDAELSVLVRRRGLHCRTEQQVPREGRAD